jgi:hypothetical protein
LIKKTFFSENIIESIIYLKQKLFSIHKSLFFINEKYRTPELSRIQQQSKAIYLQLVDILNEIQKNGI